MPLFAYPLAVAVVVACLDGAGFTAASQTLLIVLAGLTLLVAALSGGSLVLGAARSPLVWVLGLLGVLSILSAVWTVGSARDAARWGVVILAYGALAAVELDSPYRWVRGRLLAGSRCLPRSRPCWD